MEKKTIPIITYLTEEEAATVRLWKKLTNSKSMSAFIRKALYMVGYCNVSLRLDNNDLHELAETLNVFTMCFVSATSELLKRNEIDVEDIENLNRKMDEIYSVAKKCYSVILAERHANRQNVERYLVDRVDDLLGISKNL